MSDFDGKIEFEKFPPAYRLMIKYTELQDRIDKAIDYLKSDNYWLSQVKANNDLLDILKGSDEE